MNLSCFRLACLAALVVSGVATAQAPGPARVTIATVPGMPPVVDAANLYSETTANKLSHRRAD